LNREQLIDRDFEFLRFSYEKPAPDHFVEGVLDHRLTIAAELALELSFSEFEALKILGCGIFDLLHGNRFAVDQSYGFRNRLPVSLAADRQHENCGK